MYEKFLARYPEFDAVPRAAAEAVLQDARLMLSRAAWGRYYERAQALWSAHYLALRFDVGARCAELGVADPRDVSQTTSLTAATGSLSVGKTLSALQTSDDPLTADFSRTLHGLEYLDLLFAVIAPGAVVFSPDASDAGRRV